MNERRKDFQDTADFDLCEWLVTCRNLQNAHQKLPYTLQQQLEPASWKIRVALTVLARDLYAEIRYRGLLI